MINPIIYNQDEGQISHDLLPVKRRKPKFLQWFLSILKPVQWLHDLVFQDYYYGSNAGFWVTGTNYNYGDRVKDIDYKIYELITVAGLSPSTVSPYLDSINWMPVLDTFVGVSERVKYTGQTTMLEYILNHYFSIGSTALPWIRQDTGGSYINPDRTTQIYITEGTVSNGFWMSAGNGQPLTGYMSASNSAQRNFMGASPTYNPNTFTINVPFIVDAAITANQVSGITAEMVIRSIADKYVQAGKIYSYSVY